MKIPGPLPQILRNLNARQLLGMTGSILLLAGIFLPAAKVPLAGRMSLLLISGKYSLLILATALASFFLSFHKIFKALWTTGICATLMLIMSYYDAKSRIFGGASGFGRHLVRGLQDAVIKRVQFEWGLWVLLAGIILILLAAASGRTVREQDFVRDV